MVGRADKRLAKAPDALGYFALVDERIPQIVERIGEAGIELDCLFETGERFGDFAGCLENRAQIGVERGHIRHQGNRLPDQVDGVLMMVCLMRQQTQQMADIGMEMIHLQDLPIEGFRLLQIAALMVADGLVK